MGSIFSRLDYPRVLIDSFISNFLCNVLEQEPEEKSKVRSEIGGEIVNSMLGVHSIESICTGQASKQRERAFLPGDTKTLAIRGPRGEPMATPSVCAYD